LRTRRNRRSTLALDRPRTLVKGVRDGHQKRSHGTGSVFVRPNRRSTALITDGDGRRSIGTFPTRRAAETALAAALVDGPQPAIEATFGDYLTEWLADQTLVLKATTAARNRFVIATYVMGRKIASKRVRDLVPRDFRCIYGDLAKRVVGMAVRSLQGRSRRWIRS
jgi:hypothetical protein